MYLGLLLWPFSGVFPGVFPAAGHRADPRGEPRWPAAGVLAPRAAPDNTIAGLVWTGQAPPTRAVFGLAGQCLTVRTQEDPLQRYAVLTDLPGGQVGYTVGAHAPFTTPAGVVATYGVSDIQLAALNPGWLRTLASDFDPRTLPVPRCASTGGVTLQLPAAASAGVVRLPYMRDTLRLLVGLPGRPIGVKTTAIRSQAGYEVAGYDWQRDSMFLDVTRLRSGTMLRYALLHEAGHRYDARHPGALQRGVPRPFVPSEARPTPEEYRADLFAFALSSLSSTADLPAPAARAYAQLYERLLPGTTQVAALLLAHPLYARHPLRLRR